MSQAANPIPTGGWTVNSQTPQSVANSQGRLVAGYLITFTTSTGQPGSVWVPDTDYTVDTVRALIASKVATIDAIQGLTE